MFYDTPSFIAALITAHSCCWVCGGAVDLADPALQHYYGAPVHEACMEHFE